MTESELDKAFDTYLKDISDTIVASGMSIFKIAKLANLEWKTVKKAVDGVPIRAENLVRILSVIGVKVTYVKGVTNG